MSDQRVKRLLEEREKVKEKLIDVESILAPIRQQYQEVLKTYEETYRRKLNLQNRFTKIDRELAEEDGRKKVLRTGRSGKDKTKKKGGGKLDLTAYMNSLSPDEKKAFIDDLLNN